MSEKTSENIAGEKEGSEVVLKDQSIHEPTTAHQHPLETIPQGSQSDGVLNGHDKSDVHAGALAYSALGMFGIIIFSLVSMWLMMDWMLDTIAKSDTKPSRTFVERAPASVAWPIDPTDTPLQAPDEVPALMPDPETPMIELREKDEAALGGFDYAKDDAGRTTGVTLPIDRAMDITLERGLPTNNLTTAKVDKAIGEPIAMGAIPYNKKILKAEALKKGKQSPRFTPPNVGAATSPTTSTKNSTTNSTTMKTTPLNSKGNSTNNPINKTAPTTSIGKPKTTTGQPNTRSKTGAAINEKPNTQVGAMREGVN